jgi:hypothetical protein
MLIEIINLHRLSFIGGTLVVLVGLHGIITGLFRMKNIHNAIVSVGWGIIFVLVGLLIIAW